MSMFILKLKAKHLEFAGKIMTTVQLIIVLIILRQFSEIIIMKLEFVVLIELLVEDENVIDFNLISYTIENTNPSLPTYGYIENGYLQIDDRIDAPCSSPFIQINALYSGTTTLVTVTVIAIPRDVGVVLPDRVTSSEKHLFPNETVEVKMVVNQSYNSEYFTNCSNVTFEADPGINVVFLPVLRPDELKIAHFLIQIDSNIVEDQYYSVVAFFWMDDIKFASRPFWVFVKKQLSSVSILNVPLTLHLGETWTFGFLTSPLSTKYVPHYELSVEQNRSFISLNADTGEVQIT
ncbi:MAG: hypothetical protein EZS28_049382, partial [Streblomastix strix]